MKRFKFSIITATIVRPTLIQTCESIDSQHFTGVQHIVMVDRHPDLLTEEQKNILDFISNDHREIHYTNKKDGLNDYGNMAKTLGFDYVTGDYMMYMDDDDQYINNPFFKLKVYIMKNGYPNIVVFPCMRYGERFFNIPAGYCRTTVHQYCFKPRFNDKEWRYGVSMTYEQDGLMLNEMLKSAGDNVKYFDCKEELAVTSVMGRGI